MARFQIEQGGQARAVVARVGQADGAVGPLQRLAEAAAAGGIGDKLDTGADPEHVSPGKQQVKGVFAQAEAIETFPAALIDPTRAPLPEQGSDACLSGIHVAHHPRSPPVE